MKHLVCVRYQKIQPEKIKINKVKEINGHDLLIRHRNLSKTLPDTSDWATDSNFQEKNNNNRTQLRSDRAGGRLPAESHSDGLQLEVLSCFFSAAHPGTLWKNSAADVDRCFFFQAPYQNRTGSVPSLVEDYLLLQSGWRFPVRRHATLLYIKACGDSLLSYIGMHKTLPHSYFLHLLLLWPLIFSPPGNFFSHLFSPKVHWLFIYCLSYFGAFKCWMLKKKH